MGLTINPATGKLDVITTPVPSGPILISGEDIYWDFAFNFTGADAWTGNHDFSGVVSFTTSPATPFTTNSSTLVTNLNADLLDGQEGSYYLDANNLINLSENIDDRVAALIQNGTGLTWSYNDVGNTLTGNVGGLTVTQFTSQNVSQWTNDIGYLTTVDISTNTNLAATTPIVLTGDTLSHADSAVTPSTYRSVTVDQKGHVTAGSNPIIDISSETNLSATAPIVLTGDALSLSFSYNFTGADAWTGNHLFSGNTTFGLSPVIGVGAAGVDYSLTFNGEDSDLIMEWLEDERIFKVNSSVLDSLALVIGQPSVALESILGILTTIINAAAAGFSGSTDALLFCETQGPSALGFGPLFVGLYNPGTALVTSDILVSYAGAGSEGTGVLPTAGYLSFEADGNWTSSSTPARAKISLTPVGSIDVFDTVATFFSNGTTLLRSNLTIGIGAAGVDYALTFDGETNDGLITWMEDEDYFITDLISSPHTGLESERFGAQSDASGDYSVAFGRSAIADQPIATALGSYAEAEEESTAVGSSAIASNTFGSGSGAVSIGLAAYAENGSVAIGAAANANPTLGNNTAIGANAQATGSFYATAIGSDSTATGTASVCIGAGSTAGGSGALVMGSSSSIPSGQDRSTVLGGSCNATGGTADDIIVIGNNSSSGFSTSLVIGTSVSATAANQAVIGGSSGGYTSVIFGNGADNTSALASVTISATNGRVSGGNNRAGTPLQLKGGTATGNATSGYVAILTAPPGSSGAVVQTDTERIRFKNTTEAVFNDGGANYDFRFEGDTDADLFFLDASTDRIGISTNAPAELFDVDGLSRAQTFTADGDVGSGVASTVRVTGVTDTPTADPGWATSDTVAMTPPNGYIKAYVGTQAVVIPYWNT